MMCLLLRIRFEVWACWKEERTDFLSKLCRPSDRTHLSTPDRALHLMWSHFSLPSHAVSHHCIASVLVFCPDSKRPSPGPPPPFALPAPSTSPVHDRHRYCCRFQRASSSCISPGMDIYGPTSPAAALARSARSRGLRLRAWNSTPPRRTATSATRRASSALAAATFASRLPTACPGPRACGQPQHSGRQTLSLPPGLSPRGRAHECSPTQRRQ